MPKPGPIVVQAEDLEAILEVWERSYLKPSLAPVLARLRRALEEPDPQRWDLVNMGLGVAIMPKAGGRFLKVSE